MNKKTKCPESDPRMPEQRNANIGVLGERFIQSRIDGGVAFDEAWDEWQTHQRKLAFIMVDCPEVRYYDNPNICDAEDRLRIRKLAKLALGEDMKSADVSRLASGGYSLDIRAPMPTYHMDREEVRQFLAEVADVNEMAGNLEIALEVRTDEAAEQLAAKLERFANEHSLWAVPPQHLLRIWTIRFLGAEHLGLLGPVASSAIPALRAACDDEAVRFEAEQALDRITGRQPVPHL